MIESKYLADVLRQLRKYKEMAEKAVSQVSETQLFHLLDPEANSIALVMKHMAGNMRSRWTDFLSSDGEKPDRNRDNEFVIANGDDQAQIFAAWESGWDTTFAAIGSLEPDDLERVVTIRGEPHLVIEAIQRQLTHYSYHVGQIVLLAKHFTGSAWKSLSIPRGRSKELDVSKEGSVYRPDRDDLTER